MDNKQLRINGEEIKKAEIEKSRNEIESYERKKSEETKFKIIRNIKSLNISGASKITLFCCYLEKAKLREVKLKDSDIWGTNFKETDLQTADLENAYISHTNLKKANLRGAN